MDMTEGKVLALDWGTVRVGWALSDRSQTLSSRHDVYERHHLDADLDFFAELTQAEGVVAVVLGVPYNMDGTVGPQARATLEVKTSLEARLGVPVHLVDERLTSAEAERVLIEGGFSRKRRKEKRDALAATLILQVYLEKRKL